MLVINFAHIYLIIMAKSTIKHIKNSVYCTAYRSLLQLLNQYQFTVKFIYQLAYMRQLLNCSIFVSVNDGAPNSL